jgi:hypothetical protein
VWGKGIVGEVAVPTILTVELTPEQQDEVFTKTA